MKIEVSSTQVNSRQESFIQKRDPFPPTPDSNLRVYQRIRRMISDEKVLLKFSLCFGFDPSSLRKVLKNKRVSKYLVNKFQVALRKDFNLEDTFLNSPRVRRILFIFRLYQEKGSLENVGKEMNLSRERIRQLLNQGTKLGLFDYQKIKRKPLPDISKEKILGDYQTDPRLKKVASLNNISTGQLCELLQYHQISKKILHAIQITKQKEKCVKQYFEMVDKLGEHPSISQMQNNHEGHYLTSKINRLWGSIHTFRQEFGVHFIPHYGISSANRLKKTCIWNSKINSQ